ncbi:putative malate dehydrogenase, partial [Vibrio harveyi]
MTIF